MVESIKASLTWSHIVCYVNNIHQQIIKKAAKKYNRRIIQKFLVWNRKREKKSANNRQKQRQQHDNRKKVPKQWIQNNLL